MKIVVVSMQKAKSMILLEKYCNFRIEILLGAEVYFFIFLIFNLTNLSFSSDRINRDCNEIGLKHLKKMIEHLKTDF